MFQLVNGLDGPRYICETEVMDEVALAASNHEYASPGNHTSKNPNGNIITLTLKNNHLIVETEERAVSIYIKSIRMIENGGGEGVKNTKLKRWTAAADSSGEKVCVEKIDENKKGGGGRNCINFA